MRTAVNPGPGGKRWALVGALLTTVLAPPVTAQERFIDVAGALTPNALGPGDRATLGLTIEIPAGWHMWSLDPGPGPLPLRIEVSEGPLMFTGPWHGDPPQPRREPGSDVPLRAYEGQPVHLYRSVVLAEATPAGVHGATVTVRAQICSESQCIEDTVHVRFQLDARATPTGVQPEPLPEPRLFAPPPQTDDGSWLARAKSRGFLWFIFWAFAAGLGALATPCVFPAIPLTLSFFSKYSEESFTRGMRLAGTYAATMVAAFTMVGVAVSIVFGATEVQRFSQHPVFNLFLGAVLVFFGLNLLGLFEIRVPTRVLGAVNALERRLGAGGRRGAGRGLADYVVVAIAAVTATTVFFTCTVAFVGNVIVAAARGEWFWPMAGMLAFGAAFALPFFLLALFPQAAHRLAGRTGGWLGATRVTLGFLELAAAAKFFSNADLVWKWGLLSREAVLALWVPLFVMCGLYLLGKLTIGHESLARADGSVCVTQMLASTTMFALALFLAAGLISGRSFPGWISAWLPPSTYPSRGDLTSTGGLPWLHDLGSGRRRAAKEGRLVFVNYTGYTCTNCRYMEESVFVDPNVEAHLRRMTLVELYTDDRSAANERAKQDLMQRFDTVALPFYSVELPDGQVIATFAGSAETPARFDGFVRFLAEARAKGEARLAGSRAAGGDPDAVNGVLRLPASPLFRGEPPPAIGEPKWTLVNFWASWCGPCKEELESFMVRMGRDLARRGGRFLTVAVEPDDSLDAARAFARTVGIRADSALRLPEGGSEGSIDPRFELTGTLPETILVSPQGEVVWRREGAVREEELRTVLAEHVPRSATRSR